MSSQKDKLLVSAQKFIVKGQLDKAIKDYQQIVAIDQNDIRHRQKLAELLVKVNRKVEAAAEFEFIAKHFTQSLFYLKAIAVYKQIQKLEPDNINTRLSLASLYTKQGMIGNALSEYNIVANHFQKEDQTAEAMKVIEHMVEADPENLGNHLRLAEACFDAGQTDRAYHEFMQLALLYRKGADEAGFSRVSDRVAKLFPDRQEFTTDVIAALIREGSPSRAIPHLKEILARDKANLKAWDLLVDAYIATGETREQKEALLQILEISPDRLGTVEQLAQLSIEEADTAGAFALLTSHESQFLQAGKIRTLERFYLSIREKAPDDPEIIARLRNIYETLGEKEMLTELTSTKEPPAAPIEEEAPTSPPTPVVESKKAEAQTDAADHDMSWEEEIDLSVLDDEGTSTFMESEPEVADLEPEPSPIQKSEETVAEQEEEPSREEFPLEAEATGEISLEIDESNIDGAEWMKELGAPGGGTGGDVSFEISEEPDSELFSDESGVGLETPSSDEAVQPEGEIAAFEPATSAERPEEVAPAPKKRKKYDIEGQFSEFKKGLDQQLEEGDTETHYNLGIAYKEMGLLDDAVSEFSIAAMDSKRRTDCLTLQGICYRDKGDFANAEEILTMALADGGLSSEEILNLNYEIASLCEAMGRNDDALSYYRKVKALNPGFRDVANRVASLQGGEERDDTEFLELEDEESEH